MKAVQPPSLARTVNTIQVMFDQEKVQVLQLDEQFVVQKAIMDATHHCGAAGTMIQKQSLSGNSASAAKDATL